MGRFERKVKKNQALKTLNSILKPEPLLKKDSEEELDRYMQLRANLIVGEHMHKQKEAIEAKAIQHTYITLNALYALSLNSMFGFGKKRTNALIEKVRVQFDCLRENYLSSQDLLDWCLEHEIDFGNIHPKEASKDET